MPQTYDRPSCIVWANVPIFITSEICCCVDHLRIATFPFTRPGLSCAKLRLKTLLYKVWLLDRKKKKLNRCTKSEHSDRSFDGYKKVVRWWGFYPSMQHHKNNRKHNVDKKWLTRCINFPGRTDTNHKEKKPE
jgi:hypothetical protein